MITEDQQEWVLKAYERNVSLLEVKKKLQLNNFDNETIDEMLDEYERISQINKKEELRVTEEDKKEEKEFKKKVNLFVNDEDTKQLSRKDKKEIKKFLKGITQYQKVMEITLKKIKKEIELFEINVEDKKQIEKEKEFLKRDIIERIIDSKEILEIENPKTGEEVTPENLKLLNLDELIELMEENIGALQIVVNGKIE